MKILFLAPHLSTGGAPQFLLKRIESLKEYTDNEYYVVEYQCHSLDFVVQRNAIKSLLGENFTTLYEDKMELFKVIEQWQPDIIHIDEPSERLDRQMVATLLLTLMMKNYFTQTYMLFARHTMSKHFLIWNLSLLQYNIQ